ncbi:hypothetical protein [Streptomyces sp. SD15]
MSRLQLALRVPDLDASEASYSKLFVTRLDLDAEVAEPAQGRRVTDRSGRLVAEGTRVPEPLGGGCGWRR